MAERRRLPVVGNAAPKTGGASPAGGEPEEPKEQPWHWVPLGALISIAVGALLSRVFFMPFMQRQLARVYASAATVDDVRRIDATLSSSLRGGLMLRLAAGALLVTTVAVFIGGLCVGRFGDRVSARHGLLAGLVAMVMLVLFVGRTAGSAVVIYLALIPFGAGVGWLGARVGLWSRSRSRSRSAS